MPMLVSSSFTADIKFKALHAGQWFNKFKK